MDLSPKYAFSYMNDITFLNIIHMEKILFSAPFSSKIGNLAENVRLEGPEKQEIVSSSGQKTGNESPVVGQKNRQ